MIQQEISSRPQLLLSMIEDKLASEQLTTDQFSVQVSDADFAAITALAPEKNSSGNYSLLPLWHAVSVLLIPPSSR